MSSSDHEPPRVIDIKGSSSIAKYMRFGQKYDLSEGADSERDSEGPGTDSSRRKRFLHLGATELLRCPCHSHEVCGHRQASGS